MRDQGTWCTNRETRIRAERPECRRKEWETRQTGILAERPRYTTYKLRDQIEVERPGYKMRQQKANRKIEIQGKRQGYKQRDRDMCREKGIQADTEIKTVRPGYTLPRDRDAS